MSQCNFHEQIDFIYLIKNIYNQANIYLSNTTINDYSDKLFYLSRCHICHCYIQNNIHIIKDGVILKAICTKCLELLIINKGHLFQCEGCGIRNHSLNIHHWYEINNMNLFTKRVCRICNSKLLAKKLWVNHALLKELNRTHILPSWELQLLYLSNTDEYLKQRDLLYPNSTIIVNTNMPTIKSHMYI